MLGLESLSANVKALAIIGILLTEAIVLNAFYGFLDQAFAPTIMKYIKGE
ncbi:hypothetical protein ACEU6E_07860 [Halorutilales archaeon Cl-col2-1]